MSDSSIMIKKRKSSYPHRRIAFVYDFDGTLSPNNMQEDTIFHAYGIDKDKFWKKADRLVRSGYERTLAYLSLLIRDPVFQKKPLERPALKKLAQRVQYFPGVLGYFDHIERFVRSLPEAREWGVEIEHYVISSGLKEILEGTKVFKRFKRVYACEYAYEHGTPVFPKLVINDTNKTQFLFRINKGRLDMAQDINDHMPEAERRIPFRNMIYIGDSVTDIPSMTVIERYGGHAIAVYDPKLGVNGKVKKLVCDRRVSHFAPADYRKGSLLVKIVHRTLKKMICDISLEASAAMSCDWVGRHS